MTKFSLSTIPAIKVLSFSRSCNAFSFPMPEDRKFYGARKKVRTRALVGITLKVVVYYCGFS